MAKNNRKKNKKKASSSKNNSSNASSSKSKKLSDEMMLEELELKKDEGEEETSMEALRLDNARLRNKYAQLTKQIKLNQERRTKARNAVLPWKELLNNVLSSWDTNIENAEKHVMVEAEEDSAAANEHSETSMICNGIVDSHSQFKGSSFRSCIGGMFYLVRSMYIFANTFLVDGDEYSEENIGHRLRALQTSILARMDLLENDDKYQKQCGGMPQLGSEKDGAVML